MQAVSGHRCHEIQPTHNIQRVHTKPWPQSVDGKWGRACSDAQVDKSSFQLLKPEGHGFLL